MFWFDTKRIWNELNWTERNNFQPAFSHKWLYLFAQGSCFNLNLNFHLNIFFFLFDTFKLWHGGEKREKQLKKMLHQTRMRTLKFNFEGRWPLYNQNCLCIKNLKEHKISISVLYFNHLSPVNILLFLLGDVG